MSTYEAIKYNFVGTNLTALNGDNVSSGTVAAARVDSLAASKITSGSFDAARIPDLSAAKITSGTMDGGRISGGTFGAVNGSALTSLPSSAPTTSQVMSAYAAGVSGTNVVGAYGFLGRNIDLGIGNNDVTPGSNYAGSYFKYASASGAMSGSPTPSGTWKLLGRSENNAGNQEQRTSLWFRYV
tara:strand:+ start:215 stop:766 length:552 start_codon:yes stop_codon:yes gene_type:complete